MLDRQRILGKIDDVERYLADLQRLTPTAYEEYRSDLRTKYACERLLQVTVEGLADIGELFVIGERLGLPDEETGLGSRLVEAKILTQDQADLLRRMQAFRNVLVHRYGGLDDSKVFANAMRAGEDARRLLDAFRTALDRRMTR